MQRNLKKVTEFLVFFMVLKTVDSWGKPPGKPPSGPGGSGKYCDRDLKCDQIDNIGCNVSSF